MHTRVLKLHVLVLHEKVTELFFFFHLSYLPLMSNTTSIKDSDLGFKISQKVFNFKISQKLFNLMICVKKFSNTSNYMTLA